MRDRAQMDRDSRVDFWLGVLLVGALVLIAVVWPTRAQAQSGQPARRVISGSALPATCINSVLIVDVWYLTGASAGLYICTAADTWTRQTSAGAVNAITALTGDVTATGPGSVAATLATVNSNVGSFTAANITVNAKGLVTAAANGSAGIGGTLGATDNAATRADGTGTTTAQGSDLIIGDVASSVLPLSFTTATGTTIAGNVGVGTTDLDGTPAIGRITAKGTTNDGTTNIIVGRDSDEANVFSVDTNGSIVGSGTANRIGTATTNNANADTMFASSGVGKTALQIQGAPSPTGGVHQFVVGPSDGAAGVGFIVQSDFGVIIKPATGATYGSMLTVVDTGNTTRLTVDGNGIVVAGNMTTANTANGVGLGGGSAYIHAPAANNPRWSTSSTGVPVASPSSFTHLMADSGTGADKTGGTATFQAGNGTGSGGSGSILFQTAPVAASSSTANVMATRLTISPDGSAAFSGVIKSGGWVALNANYTNATASMTATALSVAVVTGRTYSVHARLQLADSLAADGVIVDFDGGSATATDVRLHCTLFDTALVASEQGTTLANDYQAATVTGDAQFECSGSFVPSSTGTFIIRASQNAHTTGTLTIYRGSWLHVDEVNPL